MAAAMQGVWRRQDWQNREPDHIAPAGCASAVAEKRVEIMAFQARLFFRLYFKSVFRYRSAGARWSVRHAVFLLAFPPLFLLMQAANRLCFLLDEILYPGFRDIAVRRPLFILGFPRSGTTHLHRLIAADNTFTALRLWEIMFAPAIVQKRLFLALGRLDRKMGGPLHRLALALEDWMFADARPMHAISHFAPEEDEMVLLHIFASAFQTFLFPFDDMAAFAHFDTALPEPQRRRIMAFYRDCIKRHLYVFGPEKYYVSKNPAFSCKVRSLYQAFPDARVICMVRNPLAAVPSAISWMSYNLRSFHTLQQPYATAWLLASIGHWYTYPLETLPAFPQATWSIERYDELVSDPAGMIRRLYAHFGYPVSASLAAVLDEATRQTRSYRSSHRYRLDEMGLDDARIRTEFAPIFERFGFGRPAADSAAR